MTCEIDAIKFPPVPENVMSDGGTKFSGVLESYAKVPEQP